MFRAGKPPITQVTQASQAMETNEPHGAEPRGADNTDKPLILAVEDNADGRATVRALLQDAFRLIEAEDGEQGIDMAKKFKPDLILMDIALPGINGIDAFRTIRSMPETAGIPVVALTASVLMQERADILAQGFEAFVAKPIQTEELFNVIREVLHGR
jgi:CheY-like chemotaxis protein